MKSKTDNDDPNRDIPYTESADPHLANARRDNELPKLIKSKTDSDDPRRVMP
jgi:hypothetical protein